MMLTFNSFSRNFKEQSSGMDRAGKKSERRSLGFGFWASELECGNFYVACSCSFVFVFHMVHPRHTHIRRGTNAFKRIGMVSELPVLAATVTHFCAEHCTWRLREHIELQNNIQEERTCNVVKERSLFRAQKERRKEQRKERRRKKRKKKCCVRHTWLLCLHNGSPLVAPFFTIPYSLMNVPTLPSPVLVFSCYSTAISEMCGDRV